MTDIADILDKAADLIEPDGKWTQGDYARTCDGEPFVGALSDEAVCWCVLGAIKRAGFFPDDQNGAAILLKNMLGVEYVYEWNDAPERTQAEVVAKLREAASVARDRDAAQRRREAAEAEGQQPGPSGIAQKEI